MGSSGAAATGEQQFGYMMAQITGLSERKGMGLKEKKSHPTPSQSHQAV